MSDIRFRHNRHAVTWDYAKACWTNIDSPPPVPMFSTWEIRENGSERRLAEQRIKPQRVTRDGITVHG